MFRYENSRHPLLLHRLYVARVLRSVVLSFSLITASLLMGMWGYHGIEGLNWVDSFANAAMILSGMGPLNPMQTDAGKIFAGCYALYSGLVIVVAVGVIVAPVLHRFMHRLHLDAE